MSKTVIIRQVPSEFSESIGLDKHNRSRLPGTSENLQVSQGADGRYITGFDEKSYLVPGGETGELGVKIKAKRERLEKATGKDFSGLSPFWSTYYMSIPSDKDLTLNLGNPMEEVKFTALVANLYVIPSKDEFVNPAYKDANYYAFTLENEVKEEVGTRKLRDKAIGKLSLIEDNVNKMVLVGQYLEGIKFTDKLGPDTLYKMLREYIEQKDLKFAKLFINALDLSTEEMQRKILIDKAFKKRLIVQVKAGKKFIYQFGQVTLGSTIKEVYTNLSDAKFSNELLAIQNELEA